jgi:hypothetical protein
MNLRKIFKEWFPGGSFCFYCSIDSTELRNFLVIVIGGLVLASLFVAFGAYLKGAFSNVEDIKIKGKVLEIEGEDHADR